REEGEKVAMAAPSPIEPAASTDASTHRRRKRRRRGRGGRGGPATGPMPERHIFEVTADGGAHPTGVTAPPEPSRAIAPRGEAPPPAVEAPPPSLSVPQERPKRTKPTRRRRASAPNVAGELESVASAIALPAPDEKPSRLRKATPRKKPQTQTVAATTAAKPKRTRATAASTDGAVKKTPRRRKTIKGETDAEALT
ncbi:MAG: hypothetical protein WAK16_10480, partial [Candidatus Cybelea sp.]